MSKIMHGLVGAMLALTSHGGFHSFNSRIGRPEDGVYYYKSWRNDRNHGKNKRRRRK